MIDLSKIEGRLEGVINGFSDQKLACDLLNVGIRQGAYIKLLRRSPFGASYLVEVDGRRLALGPEELSAINLKVPVV